jgi:hypothetical protein
MKTDMVFTVVLIGDVLMTWEDALPVNATTWSLFIYILYRGVNLINFSLLWYFPHASWISKLLILFFAAVPKQVIKKMIEHGIITDFLSKTCKNAMGYCLLIGLLMHAFDNYINGSFVQVSLLGIGLRLMVAHLFLKELCQPGRELLEAESNEINTSSMEQSTSSSAQSSSFVSNVDQRLENQKSFTCPICLEDLDSCLFNRLPCSHGVCYNCRIRMCKQMGAQKPETEQMIGCPVCKRQWLYRDAFTANKL